MNTCVTSTKTNMENTSGSPEDSPCDHYSDFCRQCRHFPGFSDSLLMSLLLPPYPMLSNRPLLHLSKAHPLFKAFLFKWHPYLVLPVSSVSPSNNNNTMTHSVSNARSDLHLLMHACWASSALAPPYRT